MELHPTVLVEKRITIFSALFVSVFVIVACTSTSKQIKLSLPSQTPTLIGKTNFPTQTILITKQSSAITLLPTVNPTPSFTASPTITSTEKEPFPKITKLIPKISPASVIINTTKIASYFLEQANPIALALDEKYIYWVDHKDPSYLYRISQQGGKPEVLVKSLYPDGRLDCIDPQTNGHWMILCDTTISRDLTEWKLRAINLDDQSQIVLLSDNNQTNLFTYFDISLNQNSVIWVITTLKGNELDENVVTLFNLATGEMHDILHKKADASIWSLISISGNNAIIEQDFDKTQGGKSALYSLDVTNGNMNDLLMGDEGSMPDFSYPWAVWKQGVRYDFMRSFIVYNFDDNRRLQIPSQGPDPIDPRINGARIYWRDNLTTNEAGNAIYIYDIEKNTTYVLETPGTDQFYENVYIYNNTIAWIRYTDFSKANHDAYIEWSKIK